MTYTNGFGSATLPPSEYGYASFTLTANATFVWPYYTDGYPFPVAKVMDIACDAGNEISLPDCTEVSTGEDFLIRNVCANVLIVKDAAGCSPTTPVCNLSALPENAIVHLETRIQKHIFKVFKHTMVQGCSGFAAFQNGAG